MIHTTNDIVLVGYAGHGFVAADCLIASGKTLAGYCDTAPKVLNPYSLKYLGDESEQAILDLLKGQPFFIGVGSNAIRAKIFQKLNRAGIRNFPAAIHPRAVIATHTTIEEGVLIGPGAILNVNAWIGTGTICNSSCIIEHDCHVGRFAHIAPGAVLTGNVQVGAHTFIGANAVVKQGVTIGDRVVIGAGSVVLNDVDDNAILVGNPARPLKKNIT